MDQAAASTQFGPLDEPLALIRAEGADVDAFLQGQLSNDVHKITAGQAQLSSYNSPKGRMLVVLTLSRHADGLDLELPRSLLEPVLRRLRMFVLRAKVSLQPSADRLFGLRGSAAEAALLAAGFNVPGVTLAMTQTNGVSVLRRHGVTPRFTLQGPPESMLALAESWKDFLPLSTRDWALEDLRAGVPVVSPATQDHFVAQMANLDLLGGIAFDKGCYTGQEIVARLHYLGQLKRRMFWARGSGPIPEPGSAVHDGDNEQAVGEVVDAIGTGDDAFEANLVLQLSHSESVQLRVGATPLTGLKSHHYD